MYKEKHQAHNERIHKTFFDQTKSSYASESQIDMIYPMLVNATPEQLTDDVEKTLYNITEERHGGHLCTGLVGIPVMTQWATREGKADFIYSMLKKREYPGYRHFFIRPQMVDGIDWVKADKDTPFCKIKVSWEKKNGSFKMNVTVPTGTSATMTLPDGTVKEVVSGTYEFIN